VFEAYTIIYSCVVDQGVEFAGIVLIACATASAQFFRPGEIRVDQQAMLPSSATSFSPALASTVHNDCSGTFIAQKAGDGRAIPFAPPVIKTTLSFSPRSISRAF